VCLITRACEGQRGGREGGALEMTGRRELLLLALLGVLQLALRLPSAGEGIGFHNRVLSVRQSSVLS
jgi:hypothetical protein